MKSSNQQTGEEGEAQALAYLLTKGYELLYKNWRHSHHEVDLIMLNDDCIVFVEVKTRINNEFGFPEEAVNKNKQKSLVKAATAFVEKHNVNKDLRFDIVAVTRLLNNWEIKHFKDAFYPYNF